MWSQRQRTLDLDPTTSTHALNASRWTDRQRDDASSKETDENTSMFPYSPTIPDESKERAESPSRRISLREVARILSQHGSVLLAVCSPALLLAIVAVAPTWWNASSYSRGQSFSHCNYDGSFTPYNHRTLSLWKTSSFFQINVYWGHMTFSVAKFLDVAFDLVVGRGVQGVLAIITYKVSSKVLGKLMEGDTVSYRTFEALAFDLPSLIKSSILSRELFSKQLRQQRVSIALLLFGSLFVLAFSTLISAMSGYSNNMVAHFQTQNTSWSDVSVVQFIIHDGDRLRATRDLPIHGSASCLFQGPGMTAAANGSGLIYGRDEDDSESDEDDEEKLWTTVPPDCYPFWRTVQYISEHGLNNSAPTPSEFYLGQHGIDLEPPTLNISTSYDFTAINVLSRALNNSLHNKSTSRSSLQSVSGAEIQPNATFIHENQTYSFEYIMTHAFCVAADSHNWGFSFLFLFITVLLLALWSITMYSLWLHAYLHSHLDRNGRGMGTYRASWDLVQAMNRDSAVGDATETMSENQIRKMINTDKHRGPPYKSVGVTLRHLKRGKTRRQDLQSWLHAPSEDVHAKDTERQSSDSWSNTRNGSATTAFTASPVDAGPVADYAFDFRFRNEI
jgi:hypothetical protein